MTKSRVNEEKRRRKKTQPARKDGGSVANPEASRKTGDSAMEAEKGAGAKKVLRKAVKKVIRVNSKKIAESLVANTVIGNLRSAEMLFSLVGPMKPEESTKKKKRHGPSVAELLASEPEWVDEKTEAMAEVGAGERKPEVTGV
jgi:hypothetical protein